MHCEISKFYLLHAGQETAEIDAPKGWKEIQKKQDYVVIIEPAKLTHSMTSRFL